MGPGSLGCFEAENGGTFGWAAVDVKVILEGTHGAEEVVPGRDDHLGAV